VLETPRARDYVPRQRPRSGEGSVIGPPPRHLAVGPDPREIDYGYKPTPPTRRPAFKWLLAIPMVLPLLTPLYNRMTPEFWGIPFFYWYQMGCAIFNCLMITFVYQVTKGKSR
jgi:hypothetical protein